VPGQARELRLRAVLSNNLGFGGQNSSIVFRAVDG
jgi:3-oxoacyl-(acyl-carrier-protein) synthase